MYRAVGGERSYRRAAFLGAVVFGASLLIAVVAGLLLPPDVIAIPALIFYEAGLVAVAVGLARFSPCPATDLVVELAESAPTSPPDALRKALGDRDLELGYWDEAADAYLDRAGRRVAIPEPDEPRQATTITRDQRRFAVLVHDRGVLEDARLADAVRVATQLTESNASLRAIVDEQLTEISASRQRLVIAGDNERAELERRLTVGPVRRVVALRSTLVTSDLTRNDHVRRASEHLTGVLDDLTRVGQGLHPRELDDGLIAAVRSLAERSPVPVRLRIGPDLDWPPQIATSAYYVCAEALTNVTKHAQATSVDVDLGTTDGSARMTIRDDGIGGVVVPGSGLIGISDRVAACGGRLVVADAGPGMLVSAVFPLETR
jgi:signal transduction histidine kinase